MSGAQAEMKHFPGKNCSRYENEIKMSFAGHNRDKHFQPGCGYVKGRVARQLLDGMGALYKCPFCGNLNHSLNSIRLCGGCSRRYFKKRNGDIVFVAN